MAPMFAPLLDRTLLVAHGGASAHAPAATLEAFKLGLRLGATALEAEVWATADRRAVIHPDGNVGGRLRRRAVSARPLNELTDLVLRPDEFYRELGRDFPLLVDLRDAAAFEDLVESSSAASAISNLWICHPDVDQLTVWHRDYPELKLIHAVNLSELPRGPEQHAATLRELEISAVSLNHNDWTAGHVALFHRFGRLTVGWMPEHVRQIAALLEMGIDMVVSDHVDRLTEAADRT